MRIADVLWFSPRFRFTDINFDDHKALVEAFRDRVEGYFLEPAERSVAANDAFAAGLVCCAAVEFIAKVSGKEHPSSWLQSHVPEFNRDKKLSGQFWGYFRDGLAHEGRVKSHSKFSGQFSLDLPTMLTEAGKVLIVNPRLLLGAVRAALHQFCDQMTDGQAAVLAKCLCRYFEAEVEAAKC
jgi:hypothetical protein